MHFVAEKYEFSFEIGKDRLHCAVFFLQKSKTILEQLVLKKRLDMD